MEGALLLILALAILLGLLRPTVFVEAAHYVKIIFTWLFKRLWWIIRFLLWIVQQFLLAIGDFFGSLWNRIKIGPPRV